MLRQRKYKYKGPEVGSSCRVLVLEGGPGVPGKDQGCEEYKNSSIWHTKDASHAVHVYVYVYCWDLTECLHAKLPPQPHF